MPEELTPTEKQATAPDLKRRLLRRILPLAFLGAAIALVAIQVTGMAHHDVMLRLNLAPDLLETLTAIELTVSVPGEGEPVSTVRFRFDAQHPATTELAHTLRLRAGDFNLQFQLMRNASEPLQVSRSLQITSDTSTTITLP